MVIPNTCGIGRYATGEIAALVHSPANLEQDKLERLLKMRAFIDSLRSERGQALRIDGCATRQGGYGP